MRRSLFARGIGRFAAGGLISAVIAMLAAATPAAAQWPGELAGRVTDAATAAPVEAATVELPRLGRSAVTDAAGAFRLRGLEPGEHRVVFRRAGFASAESTVEVRNGRVSRLSVDLRPVPVALEAVRAAVSRDRLASGTRMGRAEIEASGARTAADVVARLPGVLVRGTGPTGEQAVSIRGSSTDAVLVLVDGAPANDPVTGVADLSTVPAHAVESVTLIPGAQSARYGPRAQAGVVLIETRAPELRRAASLSAGALQEWGGMGEWGASAGPIAFSVGAQGRHVGGEFRHERDPNDPQVVTRRNADLDEAAAFAAARARVAGGELRARGGWETVDRGLPGQAFAPSPRARQELERARASAWWRGAMRGAGLSLSASGVTQRVRFRDPAPPLGLPYDDATRVRSLDLRAEAERVDGAGLLRALGGGVEALAQRVDAGSLSDAAPRARTDLGAFGRVALGREAGAVDLGFTAEGRLDRDGVSGDLYLSRSLALSASAGGARVQLANRSAFSPPTLGDQFFREGVAVAPNPDLAPERVPDEWELGASAAAALGGADVSGGATAYRGDVRGMIVWMPDFRFVWSPRNTDVKRRGVEAWGEVSFPAASARFTGSYALAAVTYDRVGSADTVQVAYRPRHVAGLRAAWSPGAWSAEVGAVYTGRRYPVPSPVNALPGFWSLELDVARRWRAGRWGVTTAVRVDRLLDETESLIFGYPEPGRRIRLDVRLERAGAH